MSVKKNIALALALSLGVQPLFGMAYDYNTSVLCTRIAEAVADKLANSYKIIITNIDGQTQVELVKKPLAPVPLPVIVAFCGVVAIGFAGLMYYARSCNKIAEKSQAQRLEQSARSR